MIAVILFNVYLYMAFFVVGLVVVAVLGVEAAEELADRELRKLNKEEKADE